jgi:hypothetical protein
VNSEEQEMRARLKEEAAIRSAARKTPTSEKAGNPTRNSLRRLAAAGLLFFIIKGLLWLLIPITIALLVK